MGQPYRKHRIDAPVGGAKEQVMDRMPSIVKPVFLICVAATMLLATSSAWAQVAASIGGTVKDTSGAVLPGVTVEAASPALIEKSRSAVTDAQGNYKFVELRP